MMTTLSRLTFYQRPSSLQLLVQDLDSFDRCGPGDRAAICSMAASDDVEDAFNIELQKTGSFAGHMSGSPETGSTRQIEPWAA